MKPEQSKKAPKEVDFIAAKAPGRGLRVKTTKIRTS